MRVRRGSQWKRSGLLSPGGRANEASAWARSSGPSASSGACTAVTLAGCKRRGRWTQAGRQTPGLLRRRLARHTTSAPPLPLGTHHRLAAAALDQPHGPVRNGARRGCTLKGAPHAHPERGAEVVSE